MSGEDVRAWQNFLCGKGLLHEEVSGVFDDATRQASIDFQRTHNLQADGVVGNKTFGLAMQLGFSLVTDDDLLSDINWPLRPISLSPLVGDAARASVFGRFNYVATPTAMNPEAIQITGTWERDNIVLIEVPQLQFAQGAPKNCKVQFHKLAAEQFKALWAAWEAADLLKLVLSWEGSYAPRFIRGSRTTLSNHAYGSAFDINARWNPLGCQPPVVGKEGAVRKLVPIANEHGFYWGGHFTRSDGMHFEIAKIL